MNILMIYPKPDYNKKPRFGFSYELLLIATILNSFHSVEIKDYSCEKYDEQWLLEQRKEKKYNLVLVECDSYALKRSQNVINAKEIISLFKGYIQTIAYGNYCCIKKMDFYEADYTIKNSDVNQIIDCINSFGIGEKIPNIEEYDKLPFVDRKLLWKIDYYYKNKNSTLFQTSKGCENTCVFCQRKGWQEHYVTHSDEYVITELKKLSEDGYKNVWITDENFSFNLKRAKRLLTKVASEIITEDMNFFISSWVNIDMEFIDLCVKCNIKIISFGIESGSEDILKFYRKNIILDKIPALIQYANEKGIFTVGNFIIGAPMETEETINSTFDFIRQCEFDQVNIKTLDYMIGSELYESLKEEYKTEDHIFSCAEYGLTNFTLKELKEKKINFLRKYYQEHQGVLVKKIMQYGQPYNLNS